MKKTSILYNSNFVPNFNSPWVKKKWAANATHSFDNPKTNLTYEKNLYIV
jgi:hypothetical protein